MPNKDFSDIQISGDVVMNAREFKLVESSNTDSKARQIISRRIIEQVSEGKIIFYPNPQFERRPNCANVCALVSVDKNKGECYGILIPNSFDSEAGWFLTGIFKEEEIRNIRAPGAYSRYLQKDFDKPDKWRYKEEDVFPHKAVAAIAEETPPANDPLSIIYRFIDAANKLKEGGAALNIDRSGMLLSFEMKVNVQAATPSDIIAKLKTIFDSLGLERTK